MTHPQTEKTELNFLNSYQVARMLGVDVSTVKRWTQSGKLRCQKMVGGHRKFLMADLADFVESNKVTASTIKVFALESDTDVEISYHIVKEDYKFLQEHTLCKALEGKQERIQQVLTGLYLAQNQLYGIYSKLLCPVLYELGDKCQAGELSIVETHIASQAIRDSIIRLQGIIRIPDEKIGKALLLNPSTELHDIALKMVDHILEEKGFQTFFSGQISPLYKIEHVFEKILPDRVYLSSTYVKDIKKTQEEIYEIIRVSQKYQATLFVGGRGFDLVEFSQPTPATRIWTFEQLVKNNHRSI